jgi:hypothetical protein
MIILLGSEDDLGVARIVSDPNTLTFKKTDKYKDNHMYEQFVAEYNVKDLKGAEASFVLTAYDNAYDSTSEKEKHQSEPRRIIIKNK